MLDIVLDEIEKYLYMRYVVGKLYPSGLSSYNSTNEYIYIYIYSAMFPTLTRLCLKNIDEGFFVLTIQG